RMSPTTRRLRSATAPRWRLGAVAARGHAVPGRLRGRFAVGLPHPWRQHEGRTPPAEPGEPRDPADYREELRPPAGGCAHRPAQPALERYSARADGYHMGRPQPWPHATCMAGAARRGLAGARPAANAHVLRRGRAHRATDGAGTPTLSATGRPA